MSDIPHNKFQPIQNPYIVGNPVRDQKMFFGREDDFTFIRQQVSGDQMSALIVLCGSRRSGKTSILFQIMNGRLGEDYLPVLIDMQAMTVENDLDFLIKLAEGITDAIGAPDITIEADFLSRREEGSLNAFQGLVRKVMSRLGGRKLVLLFDEYEIFESHIEKNLISTQVLDVFGNWLDHGEGVFMVFTGSDKLEDRDERIWGRFLQKGTYQRISFLTHNDAFRLINEPLAGVIRYEDGVPEGIWELTSGQPFYTQVFCQALVDHLNEIQSYEVSRSALDNVVEQVVENPLPQMIFAWNSLSSLEKLALSIIGELNRTEVAPVTAEDILSFARRERIGFKIDGNVLKESLEKLFNHDALAKDEGGRYTFKMGLWRRWVGRMHSIWQVIDEIKSSGDLGEGITRSKPRPLRVMLGVATVAVLLTGGVIGYVQWGPPSRNGNGIASVDSTRVTIRTEPQGAHVLLNNTRIGFSPVEGRMAATGVAVLGVELNGYQSVVDTITLQKDIPFERLIKLKEEAGAVRVSSTPAGALILVDGEPTGKQTPATISGLSVNQAHQVVLKLRNYVSKTFPAVQTEANREVLLEHVFALDQQELRVSSVPAGATVLVDGVRHDETTPTLCVMDYGAHEIVLRYDGYADDAHQVLIPVAGGEIKGNLRRLPPGKLIIIAQPYADILIDGHLEEQGKIRCVRDLNVGSYKITLRNPNYGEWTYEVRVESNKTVTVNHDFSKAEG